MPPPSIENADSPLRFIYEFRCQECRYSRKLGHARITAEAKAAKHAHTRHHHVIVWKSDLIALDTVIHMDIEPAVTEISLLDEPPF